MTLAYSTWVSVRFWSGFSSSCWARINRLFSGVRSSWDMLAMNSDLYFEETASWLTFSSIRRLGGLDLEVLLLRHEVLLREQPGLTGKVLVRPAQLLLLGAQLLGLGLGLLQQRLGEHSGLDRVQDDADALGDRVEEGLVGEAERGERGELDHRAQRPSNRTGRTMMLSGTASPSPELIRT